MLPSLVSLLILLYLRCSSCAEEDSLGNALNSIENRQKLLASNYYLLPNKDLERREFQVDDDSLMYLGDAPPNHDPPYRNRFLLDKPETTAHSYDDDYGPGSDTEEYERAFNERLLDQFLLDVVNGESEIPEQRARKRSFFREREINEISDNLQDLQPDQDADEAFALDARFVSPESLSSHRRVSQPQSHLDEDEDENYNMIANVDPSWRNHEGHQGSRNQDPGLLDRDELDAFFRYLANERDYYANEDDVDNVRDSHPSKVHRLGSHRPSQIRKRSTSGAEEKPKTSSNRTSDGHSNATSALPLNTTSEKTPTIVERGGAKGQAEVPIDLKSLRPLNIKKKSIDWSNYFGVDKRQKKSNNKHQTMKQSSEGDDSGALDQYIQSYILQSVRDAAFNRFRKRNGQTPSESSRTADDLRSAEDVIIDRVLKYTGAHQGVTDPQALRRYKERVIDELGAAYNLEKLRDEIGPDNPLRMKRQHQHAANSHHPQTKRLLKCPILDSIIIECYTKSKRGVNTHNNVLVPACAFHKSCRLCGGSEDTCAAGFLQRASGICSRDGLPHYCLDRANAVMNFLQHEPLTASGAAGQCESCIRDLLSGEYILEAEE